MKTADSQDQNHDRPITYHSLTNLLLDSSNPRFGTWEERTSQTQILDHIVNNFGVNDVLSSLAVNGYFQAEPLVCRRPQGSDSAVVIEGNRRLAACLIITGNERAKNQPRRTSEAANLWKTFGHPRVDPVPAILVESHEDDAATLSYLGVRHIASSQPWDSYAKAAWVANVIDRGDLEIQNVAKMIGDQHQTISRLLEGYYLVQQLIVESKFVPENSIRKGRGSVTEYPFSWVYTIVGYAAVRNFLKLAEGGPRRNPVNIDQLDRAQLLFQSMFGDTSRGRNSAVEDSRQLGDLAAALRDSEKVRLLTQGKTLAEIDTLTRPIEEHLLVGLGNVRDTLRDIIGRLAEQELSHSVATNLIETSNNIRKLAGELNRRLSEILFPRDDED